MKKLKLLTFLVVWVATVSTAIGQVPYFEWARKTGSESCDTSWMGTICTESHAYTILEVDANKNVYVTGEIEQDEYTGSMLINTMEHRGIYIGKYDSLGNKLWEREFVNGGTFTYITNSLLDSQENLYITGVLGNDITMDGISSGSTTNTSNIFVAKLNSSGQVIWANFGYSQSWYNNFYSTGINADNEGNIYLSGVFDNGIGLGDSLLVPSITTGGNSTGQPTYKSQNFLVKYNNQGVVQWVKQIDISGSTDVSSDAYDNIWIAGSFNDTLRVAGGSFVSAGGSDIALLKYAPDGTFLLKKQIGGTGNDYIQKLEKSGNEIKVYGKVAGTTDILGNNFAGGSFIAKINNMGIATSVTINPNPTFAPKDSEGNYYKTVNHNSIIKYDSLGNDIWVKNVVGAFVSNSILVYAPNDLRVCVWGGMQQNVVIDGITTEKHKYYLAKLNASITSTKPNTSTLWQLWPIPSQGDFNINLQEAGHVTVTDVTGKSYYSQKLGSGVHTIRLSDYSTGLYFVKVADSKGVSIKKMILE